jgi:cyanophycin synthetase
MQNRLTFRTQILSGVFGLFESQKQPHCKVRIFVNEPLTFFADDAIVFLQAVFCNTDAPILEVAEGIKGQIAQPVIDLISMGCEIAQHVLMYGSFPSFDTPRLTQFANNQIGENVLTIDVPTEMHHNQIAIKLAYELGLKIAWCFTQSKDHREQLTHLVDDDLGTLITLVRKISYGGLSTRFILKEAYDRGLPFLHCGSGIYQVGYGSKQRIYQRSGTSNDSAVGALLTRDKWTCLNHLKLSGIPVPTSFRVKDAAQAKEVADRLGYPVVVKPADRDRGEGVTVDIKTRDDVEVAFASAQGFSKNILVENRIPGICHRLLIFQERLIFAYARFPVSITGDGENTIAEIIEITRQAQNKRAKHLRMKLEALTPETIALLQSQNFEVDTVLDAGQTAYLRPYQSREWGGQDLVNTESVHPENVELACRVARHLRLETVGIDLITKDVSKPWHETGAVINEVNYKPQVGPNTAREMLKFLFPNDDAEIPIICFIGDKSAMNAGLNELKLMRSTSVNPFLTSHDKTFGPDQSEIKLNGLDNLFERVSYVLREPQADALIVVVQTDEFLHSGLPFKRALRVEIVNTSLAARTTQKHIRDPILVVRLKHLISNAGR